MPPCFMEFSSRSSSVLVTDGPYHHQRTIMRASSGGFSKDFRRSATVAGATAARRQQTHRGEQAKDTTPIHVETHTYHAIRVGEAGTKRIPTTSTVSSPKTEASPTGSTPTVPVEPKHPVTRHSVSMPNLSKFHILKTDMNLSRNDLTGPPPAEIMKHMPRYCYRLRIKPDCIEEYELEHTRVWPELLAKLKGSWFFRLFHLPARTGPDAGFPLGRLSTRLWTRWAATREMSAGRPSWAGF